MKKFDKEIKFGCDPDDPENPLIGIGHIYNNESGEIESTVVVGHSIPEQIELESWQQLNAWLDEYLEPENLLKTKLSHIPYSEPEISRELIKREFVDNITPSWNDTN